jgi:adenine/guanine phosphoribosyltransferase-like PRPP-binding protein
LENVTAAFQVSPALLRRGVSPQNPRRKPIHILLLDDIFTTGATAQAAQKVLQQAQIPVYGMVALARAGKGSTADSRSPSLVKPAL